MSAPSGERIVAGGVLGLGVLLAVATALLPEAPAWVTVGPQLFPAIVSAVLVASGALWLLATIRESAPNRGVSTPEPATSPQGLRGLAWISAALLAQMLLIVEAGFVVTSILVFAATARAFGSRSPGRDLWIGLVLALAVYLVFTRLLTLSLPSGRFLERIFG